MSWVQNPTKLPYSETVSMQHLRMNIRTQHSTDIRRFDQEECRRKRHAPHVHD